MEVSVEFATEDVWLSQKQMVELFGVTQQDVSHHVNSFLEDMVNEATYKKYLYVEALTPPLAETDFVKQIPTQTSNDKTYNIKHYNLDVITYVGFRLNSPEAIIFRRWVTQVLRQHLTQQKTLTAKQLIEHGQWLAEQKEAMKLPEFWSMTERMGIDRQTVNAYIRVVGEFGVDEPNLDKYTAPALIELTRKSTPLEAKEDARYYAGQGNGHIVDTNQVKVINEQYKTELPEKRRKRQEREKAQVKRLKKVQGKLKDDELPLIDEAIDQVRDTILSYSEIENGCKTTEA